MSMDLTPFIRNIPDFPKPGIHFKDITPLLQDPSAYGYVIDSLTQHYQQQPIDTIIGIESRGFLFAATLAYTLKTSLAIIRKQGKLPHTTVSYAYQLEYGEDSIEIHEDAFQPGSRILLIDDLLATGGTLQAATALIEKMQGKIISIAAIIELKSLNGRKAIENYDYFNLMRT